MVFSKTQWKGNFIFQYEGKDLEIVQEFKYLGVIFNYNGSFVKNRKHVYEQAQRAMFSLLRQLDLPLDIQLELFDTLIMPILTYGCEVWGCENLNIIEKLHLKYLKHILGVKMSTPTCMVLGETGRFPVNITIKTRMISFWSKLILCEKNKLSVAMYRMLYSKHVNNITMSKWLTSIKQTLDNCGYSYMWLQQDVNINKFPLIVQRSLQDQYRQDWNNIVSISSKCDLYRLFKPDHILESYLKHPSPTVRRIVCKLRTCNHKLPVESGRYANLPRCTRYCNNCNMQRVGDEYHFLLECPELQEMRWIFATLF